MQGNKMSTVSPARMWNGNWDSDSYEALASLNTSQFISLYLVPGIKDRIRTGDGEGAGDPNLGNNSSEITFWSLFSSIVHNGECDKISSVLMP